MAFRVLELTNPLMQGPDVSRAQTRLQTNPYGNYRPGPVDGEYGQKSHAATKRAKYWLGYPRSDINGRYGLALHKYLGGSKALTPLMRARRKYRLSRAAAKPLRVKAYERAVSQIGVEESPRGSNRVKYTEWYGLVGPWCAMFVTWCYVLAGSKRTFVRGQRYSYVPYLLHDARMGDHALRTISAGEVRKGDLVLYQFDSDVNPDHIGLFEEWTGETTFTAIEGNTSQTSADNGGAVMRQYRHTGLVKAFVRAET